MHANTRQAINLLVYALQAVHVVCIVGIPGAYTWGRMAGVWTHLWAHLGFDISGVSHPLRTRARGRFRRTLPCSWSGRVYQLQL